MEYIIIQCPHCKEYILIYKSEINCSIFRHGVLKSDLKQISPHATETECINLSSMNFIYGCGLPFKINCETMKPEICGYI